MYESHAIGLAVIQDILALPIMIDDTVITQDFQQQQLTNIAIIEEHIKECGKLSSLLDQLSPTATEKLYERLIHWRNKRPRWSKLQKMQKEAVFCDGYAVNNGRS